MYPQECPFRRNTLSRAVDSYPRTRRTRFVLGHDFSRAVTCGRYDRRHSLLKNSSFDFVLKGRGFQPRRKCHKINSALAAEAPPQTAMPLFQQTVQPLAFEFVPQLTENS